MLPSCKDNWQRSSFHNHEVLEIIYPLPWVVTVLQSHIKSLYEQRHHHTHLNNRKVLAHTVRRTNRERYECILIDNNSLVFLIHPSVGPEFLCPWREISRISIQDIRRNIDSRPFRDKSANHSQKNATPCGLHVA